jgi:signal transduction histidine kinase
MILITIILSTATVATIGLGTTVFLTNVEKKTNQAYLISSIFILLFLLANLFTLYAVAKSTELIILAINLASATSACTPSSFQLLRLSIKYPSESWGNLLRRCAVQILLNVVIIFICFLPSFTQSVEFPPPGSAAILPQPVYGHLYIFFVLYFVGSICVLGFNLFLDRKRLQGAQRLESEFLVFACLSGLCVGAIGILFVLILKSSAIMPITNAAGVFTILLIVAYGITFYKILTVSALLRKASAYVLLMVYLCTVYYTSWFVLLRLGSLIGASSIHASHLLATIIVVFAIPPAKQRLEQATERLFRSSSAFDVQATLKRAGEIFQSVTTINQLLGHFSELIYNAVGTNKVTILAPSSSGFQQVFPLEANTTPITFNADDEIVRMLASSHEPASLDSLHRMRQTPLNRGAAKNLTDHNVAVATGTFSKTGLSGIVLIGARRKGHVYDKNELDALQLLSNQLAVALENAQLYTELQDSKIRNDIMLDQLVSGVIVANPEREITLFNHEAQRITGLSESQAVGNGTDVLPRALENALVATLDRGAGIRNLDATLFGQEEEENISIRMGTAFLYGHDDKPMGALLVFTDLTELKSLEEQVRRSDQLSSVGTLAAGMAHEIKNPLVTIKTFTQLLPERYADADFRKDFSDLVAHEVTRIDGIVNELLSFSKPTKPLLVPMHVHESLEQTMKLMHEQMVQKNIKLKTNLLAARDNILGDAKLLSQALVNLHLNAIEAIEKDGLITVNTSNGPFRFADPDNPRKATTRHCIRIQISDTGSGIPPEDLQKIFDPFFTKKSQGTGMGLSVAHGIITEHHGVVEVDSAPEKGTSFTLYIPVLEENVVS